MANARFTSAQEVFSEFPMMAEDMVAAPEDTLPLPYLDKLAASETPEDAITFAAFLLDRRETVWWAAQCIRQMGSPENRPEEIALLTAEAWVRDPEEHRRIAAMELGVTGDRNLPGSWVALAAGGSGGTLFIGNEPGPPVPLHLCAKAARTGVLIALARIAFRDRRGYIAQCASLCRKLHERA